MFTYGYAKGVPVAPGASLVTIALEDHGGSTRLRLTHAFSEPRVRDEHLQGWRISSRLRQYRRQRAARGQRAASSIVGLPSGRSLTPAPASPSCGPSHRATSVYGTGSARSTAWTISRVTSPHPCASCRAFESSALETSGSVEGMAVSDWLVLNDAGEQRATGLSVFELGADGRIRSVTGFGRSIRWRPGRAIRHESGPDRRRRGGAGRCTHGRAGRRAVRPDDVGNRLRRPGQRTTGGLDFRVESSIAGCGPRKPTG